MVLDLEGGKSPIRGYLETKSKRGFHSSPIGVRPYFSEQQFPMLAFDFRRINMCLSPALAPYFEC